MALGSHEFVRRADDRHFGRTNERLDEALQKAGATSLFILPDIVKASIPATQHFVLRRRWRTILLDKCRTMGEATDFRLQAAAGVSGRSLD